MQHKSLSRNVYMAALLVEDKTLEVGAGAATPKLIAFLAILLNACRACHQNFHKLFMEHSYDQC